MRRDDDNIQNEAITHVIVPTTLKFCKTLAWKQANKTTCSGQSYRKRCRDSSMWKTWLHTIQLNSEDRVHSNKKKYQWSVLSLSCVEERILV